ncbi:MAG: hypothetical protein ACPKPY_11025 [Nitrososphaeraceae archaeon]
MNNKIIVHDSNDNNNLNNDNVKIDVPLKPKINQIKSQINIQIVKMQNVFSELKVQDKEIYQKLFISIKENNIQYSSLTLSELTKLRDISKSIWMSKIVLDVLRSQMNNATNFKDLIDTIIPLLTAVKSIRSLLVPYLKEADAEYKKIFELLSDVLINASQVGGYMINFKIANQQITSILNEAYLEAEYKIKNEFEPIPDIKI